MLDTTIQVKTDRFDGPLALLLLLIKKQEMDIRELDMTVITEQYLEYLVGMQNLNFGVAGDYLYLASTLLLLKSKTALSPGEPQLDTENMSGEDALGIQSHTELVRRLEELAHFQRMGQKIWELPKLGENNFTRPRVNRKEILEKMGLSVDINLLVMAMVGLMEKERRQYAPVERDPWNIREKLSFLKEYLREGMRVNIQDILGEKKEKGNVIATLISLLELARLKKIELSQEGYCTDIGVNVTENLDDFDVDDVGFLTEHMGSVGMPPQ